MELKITYISTYVTNLGYVSSGIEVKHSIISVFKDIDMRYLSDRGINENFRN